MKFYSIDIDRDSTCSMIGGFKHDPFVLREVIWNGHSNQWSNQVQVDIVFVTEDGVPERLVDYVDLPGVGFPAISDKVRQVVLKIAPESIELFPVELVREDTGQYLGTYWILKVIRSKEALDVDNTQWFVKRKDSSNLIVDTNIRRAALVRSSVESEDLFQLVIQGLTYRLFASSRLRDALVESNAANGFKFIEADVF